MAFPEYDRFDGLGLAEQIARREVSAAEVLEEALARTSRLNPRINAVVLTWPDVARQRARETLPAGPFRGVPFLLKDLHASYPGFPTTAGSRLFRHRIPAQRSVLVRRFEDAGLVLFGKTNTPELGLLPVTEPELFGVTRNPWRLDVTAGGSSGGAAAAVAAGLVPMAHGSDGGGSIRIPASCCGVFGFKPSRGWVPVGPDQSEIFFGFATEGVLTRSVRDCAAILDAVAGADEASLLPPRPDPSLSARLGEAPGPLRVALCREPLLPGDLHPDVVAAVDDTAALLAHLGHHVEEARPRFDGRAFARGFLVQWASNLAGQLAEARTPLGRPVRQDDVEERTWLLGLMGRSTPAAELVLERSRLLAAARDIVRFFRDYDVLLTPTLGSPPIPHGALDATGTAATLQNVLARLGRPGLTRLPGLIDRLASRAYAFAPFTAVFNITGQPSASVPLSWNADGLPIGTLLTGRVGDDELVLRLAAQLESARPWFDRRPPHG
ncbi:MAG: amidase [Sandaracinaceae bacterium]